MKGAFIWVVLVLALGISYVIYNFLLPDFVKNGGPLVVGLITLSILLFTFVFERLMTLGRAAGKRPMSLFISDVKKALVTGDITKATKLCADQRGSAANVLRAGFEAYSSAAKAGFGQERKMVETQRAMEEATALETPLLERNLIIEEVDAGHEYVVKHNTENTDGNSTSRVDERFGNPQRQLDGIRRRALPHGVERADHSDNRSEQPHHRRDRRDGRNAACNGRSHCPRDSTARA